MNQPLESTATAVFTAGQAARLHAHIERRPGIDPWVVVQSRDATGLSLILSFAQARQLLDSLTVVCAAAHIRGEGCAA